MANKLQPGRELDALIAEKVMGWHRAERVPHIEGENWVLPDGSMPFYGEGPTGRLYALIPPYSTNMAAAWQVFEAIANRPGSTAGSWMGGHVEATIICGGRRGYAVRTGGWVLAMAETAPHAICLAALAAVESEAVR